MIIALHQMNQFSQVVTVINAMKSKLLNALNIKFPPNAAPTIPLDELHGSLYRLNHVEQGIFLARAPNRKMHDPMDLLEMNLETKNHHWELNLNGLRQPWMFAQNQGLKYNADYKEEMNRLYNLNGNGEPLVPPLGPEERRQNPRVYNPEAHDRILNTG